MIEAKTFYKKSEGLDQNEVPDGYVIYDEARDKVHFLNPTAAAVLELCDGETDVDMIADALRNAFDLSAPPVKEVSECVAALVEQHLIAPCQTPSSAA